MSDPYVTQLPLKEGVFKMECPIPLSKDSYEQVATYLKSFLKFSKTEEVKTEETAAEVKPAAG